MIPKKIRPYFSTIHQAYDGDNIIIEGTLTCCNAHDFEVFIFGEMRTSMFSKMYLSSKNDRIVMDIRCKKCGKVISVFDSSCDGYEQCGKKHSAHVPAQVIGCKKCRGDGFSICVKYEYPDVKELLELELTEPDNAFTWIWSTLECNKCGTKYKNLIDYETT